MQITIKEDKPATVAKLKLHMKVCDTFECEIVDPNGATLLEYEGYVPDFFPGTHYGDYLILDIDVDSGRILNWPKVTPSEIEEFIEDNSEE